MDSGAAGQPFNRLLGPEGDNIAARFIPGGGVLVRGARRTAVVKISLGDKEKGGLRRRRRRIRKQHR